MWVHLQQHTCINTHCHNGRILCGRGISVIIIVFCGLSEKSVDFMNAFNQSSGLHVCRRYTLLTYKWPGHQKKVVMVPLASNRNTVEYAAFNISVNFSRFVWLLCAAALCLFRIAGEPVEIKSVNMTSRNGLSSDENWGETKAFEERVKTSTENYQNFFFLMYIMATDEPCKIKGWSTYLHYDDRKLNLQSFFFFIIIIINRCGVGKGYKML